MITKDLINAASDYEAYFNWVKELVDAKSSSGEEPSENFIHFTKLNYSRMKRLNKTTTFDASLLSEIAIDRPITFLVLTESWCGDAAQIIPVIAKLADEIPNLGLKLILRDENPEIMDAFLTNGSRSIPKLILLDTASLEVLGSWGPRPAKLTNKVNEWKVNDDITKVEMKEMIQRWYTEDKTSEIQKDLIELLGELK